MRHADAFRVLSLVCAVLLVASLPRQAWAERETPASGDAAAPSGRSWRGIGSTGMFPAEGLVHTFWDIDARFPAERIHGKRPEWSKLSKEARPGTRRNIVWRTLLPHWGHNAPVAMGGKVFLMCEEGWRSDAPVLVCLDIADGRILWQQPVDHLDAWPGAKAEQAKAMRAKELKRWHDHMTWWNRLYWDNAKHAPSELDEAHWKRVAKEALADGWEFPSHEERRLSGPADCGNGAYRYRYGRGFNRGMNGRPVDASLIENWRHCNEQRIYWRPGWTSEGPFYGSTMGSVVADGQRVYAATALGAVAAYSMDGRRHWVTDLGVSPVRTGLPCDDRYKQQQFSSPVLAGEHIVLFHRDMAMMYAVKADTGQLAWKIPAPKTDQTHRDFPQHKGRRPRGFAGHMAPGGTPVVMQLPVVTGNDDGDGRTQTVVVSGHGMAVRVSDGAYLGQVRLPLPEGAKADEYSSTYSSWAAHGDVLYAQHFKGWVYAVRLSITDNALGQQLRWRAKAQGDNRDPNLVIDPARRRLFCGPLALPQPEKRAKRMGYCALDAATGGIVARSARGPGGYSTSLGFAPEAVVMRTSGWSRDKARWTSYSALALPDLTFLGEGFLAPPAPEGEVAARHIALLGTPYIAWGPAGITCWGNRIFVRSNDYLWCLGDPDEPFKAGASATGPSQNAYLVSKPVGVDAAAAAGGRPVRR